MKTRIARCGHEVPSHRGRQRLGCDHCGYPVAGRTSNPAGGCRALRPESIACVACGSDVLVSEVGPIPKYCSGRCRAWWYNHPGQPTPPLGQCARCSAPLRRISQKYCGLRCSEIARGTRLAEPPPRQSCALPGCGKPFQPKRDGTRCCSEKHGKLLYNRESRADGRQQPTPWNDRRRDNYHRRRALKKGASTGRPVNLAEIAARDRYRCGVCRKAVSMRLKWPHPRSASLDHVIPLTETGSQHDPANVRLAHLACNTSRGNRGGGEQLMLFG